VAAQPEDRDAADAAVARVKDRPTSLAADQRRYTRIKQKSKSILTADARRCTPIIQGTNHAKKWDYRDPHDFSRTPVNTFFRESCLSVVLIGVYRRASAAQIFFFSVFFFEYFDLCLSVFICG
jgi:hypothetical protein